MRYTTLTLAIAGLILTSGCSSLVSLQPFVTAEQSTFDERLVGTWSDPEGESTYVIQRDAHRYRITAIDASETLRFEARLLQAGTLKILDVVRSGGDDTLLRVHFAIRVWIEGPVLRFGILDSDWFKDEVRQSLPVHAVDSRIVIAAPSAAMEALLLQIGRDARAYTEIQSLNRVQ
jgi:hypothetical protein